MGPGPRGPGNIPAIPPIIPDHRLQWGRGRAVPEIRIWTAVSAFVQSLQWGRGRAVPEMAGTVTPAPLLLALQWGRGRAVPEIAWDGGL